MHSSIKCVIPSYLIMDRENHDGNKPYILRGSFHAADKKTYKASYACKS